MFPSVRLMIVAMSASLLAVVCGMTLFMGLFAAFSIAHEPFSALPTGKPPLQLALEEASTPSDVRPAPFGTRFQVKPAPGSGAKITPVAPDHGPALPQLGIGKLVRSRRRQSLMRRKARRPKRRRGQRPQ